MATLVWSCRLLPFFGQRESPLFKWTPAAQEAFDRLKYLFTSAPILRHFDPDLQITLQPDTSLSGIISQPHLDHNGHSPPHPVVYWSRKCTPAESNYDIHDHEMLAQGPQLGSDPADRSIPIAIPIDRGLTNRGRIGGSKNQH